MTKTKTSKAVHGILLLNKPQGITSNKALQIAKRLFGADKAGHSGSLDPLATGMLPICFGEATKVCQFLLDADKCYETTGLLGIKTDSSDATGNPIQVVDSFSISNEQLASVLPQFMGLIKQTPSMYSALKHQGQPLYRYARKGIDIERKAREVMIHQLDLKQFNGKEFDLNVVCSKGTYIRNLVEDIGDHLGVGAHVTRLHRVYTAGLEQWSMFTLEELEQMTETQRMDCLVPSDKAIEHMLSIVINDSEVLAIRQGRQISHSVVGQVGELMRLYDEDMSFIGIGEYLEPAIIKGKRLLAFDSTPHQNTPQGEKEPHSTYE